MGKQPFVCRVNSIVPRCLDEHYLSACVLFIQSGLWSYHLAFPANNMITEASTIFVLRGHLFRLLLLAFNLIGPERAAIDRFQPLSGE